MHISSRHFSAVLAIIPFLLLAACVQQTDRDPSPSPPPPSPTAAAQTTPTATAAPSPTATPMVLATATTIALPTRTPVATNTPIPPEALRLDVQGPADGAVVRNDAVVVFGVASGDASVEINGVAAAVSAVGAFSAEVALVPGANVIDVVATDDGGRQASSSISVTYVPPQPFVLIVTEPEDQSVVSTDTIPVTGRTSSDAIATVNGVSIPVDELGIFSTDVTLEPGPNIIEIVVSSATGEVRSALIAVIYRP